MYIIYPYIIPQPGGPFIGKNWAMVLVLKTEGIVFSNTDTLRLVKNIFIFFLKLNEILPKRARMIKGCNYGKILHELKNFSSSRW